MHLAVTKTLLPRLGTAFSPDAVLAGSVLVDACGQAGHYRAKTKNGDKFYDLAAFRAEHSGRLKDDGFCLGYYLHLVQDMVYRKFVYEDHGWSPQSPGNVDRLYNDYRLLNPYLAQKYALELPALPESPLLPANAEAFLEGMKAQFLPYDEGEHFFLTRALADEYVLRAAEACLHELDALSGRKEHINPMNYSYTSGFMIRKMSEEEYPLLRDFLYDAIFQRDENNLLPRNVIDNPELRIYIEDFGKKEQDFCLCAELGKDVIGAVWVRDIPAYGHIADGVPEFAISVKKAHRGTGVGTRLMQEMIKHLRAVGCPRASLAVQKDNYALRMYQKVGFTIIGENEEEFIMEIRL